MHPIHAQPGFHEEIGGIGIAMLQHPGSLQRMRHTGDECPCMPVIRILRPQPVGEIFRVAVVDPAKPLLALSSSTKASRQPASRCMARKTSMHIMFDVPSQIEFSGASR